MSWTGKKTNVSFSKPSDPSFLKKFKEKVGYKDDKGINEKFQIMPPSTNEDLEDADDEKPQVVQLNPEDLSQDEYEKIISQEDKQETKDEHDGLTSDGRIMFRKPIEKRENEHDDLNKSNKKQKSDLSKVEINKDKKKDKKVKINNKKLLSFNEDDEDIS